MFWLWLIKLLLLLLLLLFFFFFFFFLSDVLLTDFHVNEIEFCSHPVLLPLTVEGVLFHSAWED